MSNSNIVQASAMPKQELAPLQPGANSPGQSAAMLQQQQINKQMALTGKTGGKRVKTGSFHLKGGVPPNVEVPNPPPGSVNPQQTQGNYTQLTALAQQQQQQSTYDNAKTPAETAALQSQNNKVYNSTGGRASSKKGGYWPKWGCLSGGKHTKVKTRKGKKVTSRRGKNRRTKTKRTRRTRKN
jgi:hypothetical protein